MLNKNRYKRYISLFYIVSGRRYGIRVCQMQWWSSRAWKCPNKQSNRALMQWTNRDAYYYWGSAVTVAVSNCQPVRQRSRRNSLFDRSLFYTAIYVFYTAMCSSLCQHYVNANHFMQLNFDITCNKCRSKYFEIFPWWVRIFLIVFYARFYTQFPTAYLNTIFKLRDGTYSFILWSLLWIISQFQFII